MGMLLPHRHPGVSHNNICARHCFACIASQGYVPASGLCNLNKAAVTFIAFWDGYAKVELKQSCCLNHRIQHIIAITKPRKLKTGQSFSMLHHGQKVGNDLAGMRQISQAVDDGHAGVMCQFRNLVMVIGADHDGIDIA